MTREQQQSAMNTRNDHAHVLLNENTWATRDQIRFKGCLQLQRLPHPGPVVHPCVRSSHMAPSPTVTEGPLSWCVSCSGQDRWRVSPRTNRSRPRGLSCPVSRAVKTTCLQYPVKAAGNRPRHVLLLHGSQGILGAQSTVIRQ